MIVGRGVIPPEFCNQQAVMGLLGYFVKDTQRISLNMVHCPKMMAGVISYLDLVHAFFGVC